MKTRQFALLFAVASSGCGQSPAPPAAEVEPSGIVDDTEWSDDDSWRARLGEHLVGNVETAPAVLDHFAWLTALDERASGPALALARRAAERAVREQSENPLHRDTLAYVYQRLGLFDAAVELQREPPARSRGCPPRGGAPTLPREGAGNQLDRSEGSRQSSPCRDLRSLRGGRSD